jgi:hypothetical protein
MSLGAVRVSKQPSVTLVHRVSRTHGAANDAELVLPIRVGMTPIPGV